MNNLMKAIASGVMFALPVSAFAIQESEVNQPISSAQTLNVPQQGIVVNGFVGAQQTTQTSSETMTRDRYSQPVVDIDYFRFYANARDVYTIDIDQGTGGAQSVDTIIAVFDENGVMLRTNDNTDSLDEGSINTLDARIDEFVVPNTGYYTVGVAAYPQYFVEGGNVSINSTWQSGDYELHISYEKPSVKKQVSVMVKPGESGFTRINPKSRGRIPVAILGSSELNVAMIDESTLRFGASGTEASLAKCHYVARDVNGDGHLDKTCLFDMRSAGFTSESVEGKLSGMTTDGMSFEGAGALKVVPAH